MKILSVEAINKEENVAFEYSALGITFDFYR